MTEPTGPKLRSDSKLVKRGWSEHVYDICWMDCPEPGYHLVSGGAWEICLCIDHILEMESSAGEGYSACDPPKTGGVYTIWEYDDSLMAKGIKKATSAGMWWPWEPINREDTA